MMGLWRDQDAEIRPLVAVVDGSERNVVEVKVLNQSVVGSSKYSRTTESAGEPFYIDDDEGQGIHLVTMGEGKAIFPHTLVRPERIVRERALFV